jgi:hypothetical protein
MQFWAGIDNLHLLEIPGEEETDADRLTQIEDEDGPD